MAKKKKHKKRSHGRGGRTNLMGIAKDILIGGTAGLVLSTFGVKLLRGEKREGETDADLVKRQGWLPIIAPVGVAAAAGIFAKKIGERMAIGVGAGCIPSAAGVATSQMKVEPGKEGTGFKAWIRVPFLSGDDAPEYEVTPVAPMQQLLGDYTVAGGYAVAGDPNLRVGDPSQPVAGDS